MGLVVDVESLVVVGPLLVTGARGIRPRDASSFEHFAACARALRDVRLRQERRDNARRAGPSRRPYSRRAGSGTGLRRRTAVPIRSRGSTFITRLASSTRSRGASLPRYRTALAVSNTIRRRSSALSRLRCPHVRIATSALTSSHPADPHRPTRLISDRRTDTRSRSTGRHGPTARRREVPRPRASTVFGLGRSRPVRW
jgi:hypothetical protein